MAEVIWTVPALDRLNVIADYIARDNADAANRLVSGVFGRVDLLERFPAMGRSVPEMRGSEYREIVVRPCRVIYRIEGGTVRIITVIRGEQNLTAEDVIKADLNF
ncbi:MAG: type II toxin-antitoxin system RelE/ParE family toxin [Akkermansiaceae bacterium]|nr:type II toxin-antitoxin system RelE/ParE family toxin [Verrucomicrobiales bacterium]